MKPKLAIWGASGHAAVVADVVRSQGEYEVAGFLDDASLERAGTEFCGALILGGSDRLDDLMRAGVEHLVFGFGDCEARLRLSESARRQGFAIATVVHPRAVIAPDASVSSGTVVVAGAVINPGAQIGADVIVNTSASVDHDCIIEDDAHISPGVRLAGSVRVGRGSWVGIGATVVDGVRVGAGAIVGAGAVVLADIPDGVVAYGVPARVVRKVGPKDR